MHNLVTINAQHATLTIVPTNPNHLVLEDLSDEYNTRFWIMDRTTEVEQVLEGLSDFAVDGVVDLDSTVFEVLRDFNHAANAVLKVDATTGALRLAKKKGMNAFPAKHLRVNWTNGELRTETGAVLFKRNDESQMDYIEQLVTEARKYTLG